MARLVQQAATGTPTLAVPFVSKMRFRPRLPSKSQKDRAGSRPQAPDVLVRFSINMPRQIRSRIAYPRIPKLQRALSSDSSEEMNHEVVLSPTGRLAMGPWLGPFEGLEATAETNVYFVDGEGIAHSSLVAHIEEVQEAQKRTPTPSLVDIAVSSARRAHLQEVRQAHLKVSTQKNWPSRRHARSAARMNKVHQPRQHY